MRETSLPNPEPPTPIKTPNPQSNHQPFWYGYYKFSVEEELFQDELATDGRVTGCGGYGSTKP